MPEVVPPLSQSASASAPATAPPKLDDIMIAMDVVDMVRHREDLVRRELNETGREAELIERLREIYRQQGIEVSDKVLEDGVKALKESRFTYTPPPRSWKRTLLEMWTVRGRFGSIAGVILAALMSVWGVHYFTVTRPAELAELGTRTELTETLPRRIRQAHDDILKSTKDATAVQQANQMLADGERAIRDKDRAAMEKSGAALTRLRDDVLSEYTLTIVSRPGETTGFWRHPNGNTQAFNYYIVVEPITPTGTKLKLPIRNEETGAIDTVDKFGVRVPRATFDAVGADKRDDGIVQNNRFGVKHRGGLAVEYLMPYDGGMITKW